MPRPDRLFEWHVLTGRAGDRSASTGTRFNLLLGGFALTLAAIFARALQLEVTEGAAFRQAAARPGRQVDLLPAERGSILARDGTPLAVDERAPCLEIHYRWLEDPPDPDWLRRQARGRLLAAERRQPELVAQAEAAVRANRDAWRRELAERLGISEDAWRQRAARIQRRVETIARRVNDAHLERLRREQSARGALFAKGRADAGENSPGDEPSGAGADNPANGGWRGLAADLFGVDAPGRPERVIVSEERAYHVIAEGLSASAAAAIREAFQSRGESRDNKDPSASALADATLGARLTERVRRSYPQGEMAANVLGYVAPADPAMRGAGADGVAMVEPGAVGASAVGVAGVERVAESTLRGQTGRRVHVVNQRGQRIAVQSTVEPVRGADVRLTLDPRLQRAAELLLDRAIAVEPTPQRPPPVGGAIVVMDVQTGELLAAASAPRFDPNAFTHADGQPGEALAAPGQPLFDRASRMALPPGSVFKIVSAIALLEQGLVTPQTEFACQGYLNEPDRLRCAVFRRQGVGHGSVRLADALAASCNTYFFHFAEQLGPGPLLAWAERFGAACSSGSGLADESAGRLATPGSILRLAGRSWRAGDTEGLAVGQGYFSATPLQVARWIGAVANGGYLVRPQILLAPQPQVGQQPRFAVTDSHAGARLPISPANLNAVREGLQRAITDPDGTGHAAAQIAWPTLAGKTGTAEVGPQQADHAWFAGYAPADEARWAIVVALEHGGSGATAAAPIVRRLAQALDELGYTPAP